jgi:hypothetical protein
VRALERGAYAVVNTEAESEVFRDIATFFRSEAGRPVR